MAELACQSVFNSDQLAQLRSSLARKYDELLPALEHAVRKYPSVLPPGEHYRRQVRRHLDAAEGLLRASDKLLNLIQGAEPFIAEARDLNLLPTERYALVTDTLYELASMKRRLRTADEAQATVQALRADVQLWQKRARSLAQGTPGRKAGDPGKRIGLCAWVGMVLSKAGIRLSTVPAETWGQVYALACDAARIPLGNEHDVGRDLRNSLTLLHKGNQIDASMVLPARKKARTPAALSRPRKNRT